MAPLARADRLWLWTLLPLFAVVLTLHVREVARTGLSQPPVYAAPASERGGYPTVGGFRIERGLQRQGLRVGDRLISVGGEDLRGVGYLTFDGIALEHAGTARETPLVYERDGERREMTLRMPAHDLPWFRIPFVISVVAMATLILLRSPGSLTSRAFFAGCVSAVIIETPLFGGPRLQSLLNALLFNFGGAVALVLLLRGLRYFPEEVPDDRRAPGWLIWVGAIHLVVRLNYIFDTPVPSDVVPRLTLATDVLIFGTAVGVVSWNFVQATPIGRRRLKWGLLGLYAGSLPMIATLLLRALQVELPFRFVDLFQWSGLMAVAIPLGLLIAVVRYNLFDIDRVWSATATYSLLGAALLALLLGVTPALADAVAAVTGADAGTARLALGVALGALLLPAQRRLRTRIDDRLFPRHRAVEQGIDALLRDLPQCASAGDVHRLLADRLAAVLQPERCAVFALDGNGLLRAELHGAVATEAIAARSRVALQLAGDRGVVEVGRARRSGDWGAEAAASGINPGEFELLVGVRRGLELAACIALGPLRSGDVYTRTDIGLLRAVAERASAELQRLVDQDAIRAERLRGERIAAQKAAAEEAQATRSRFLAAASHDLRQPLHALGVYAELLEDQLGSDRAPATLERLRASTGSLREMFGSLLDLSRLDVGAVEPDVRVFALEPLLRQLAADAEPLAAEKGLALSVGSSEVQVRSDPVLLGRILRNLVSNAVRYTERGEVAVRATGTGDRVAIEVVDTGPGIAEEQRGEIFDEFVRGEGAARSSTEGLGLGLTIVDRLARQLGHRVELESELGRGSCFRVTLPAVAIESRAELVAPGSGRAALAGAELKGRVVVVIDDELPILEAMRDLLESWGSRPVLAASAAEALEGLEARDVAPDAVLADYRLDRGTGLDAVAELRARFDDALPAAIVSGESGEDSAQRVRDAGLPLVPKPASPARLRATLLQLLRA